MTDPGDRPVAVIDLGSGAAKLLVIDRLGLSGDEPILAHRKVETHLGTVVTAERDGAVRPNGTGRPFGVEAGLAEAAITATEAALDSFAEVIAGLQPDRVAVVGTAWARTVPNLDRIESLIQDRFGTGLEVLSGQREAELAFTGARSGRDVADPVAMIDLGAASTEFALQRGDLPLQTYSLPIGARTITDLYLPGDPPRPEELSSALSVVELYLDDLRRDLPDFVESVEAGTVLGVGATGQVAEVEIGLPDPDNESVDGYRMEKAAVEEVFRALATESAAERAGNPGLRVEDVADIVGALCILVEFMRRFGAQEIVVSERGLMHGLAAELMAKR